MNGQVPNSTPPLSDYSLEDLTAEIQRRCPLCLLVWEIPENVPQPDRMRWSGNNGKLAGYAQAAAAFFGGQVVEEMRRHQGRP